MALLSGVNSELTGICFPVPEPLRVHPRELGIPATPANWGHAIVGSSYRAWPAPQVDLLFVLCIYPEIILGSSRPRQEKLPAHNFARIFRSNSERLP
ncbi:hypothetical protein [Polaromonas sp. AER18D-145]|uniref:hypothetical protein n=1 Tax=Polaromonas sp. AER18D-145 TaxID=1977060 RepID=UPI0011417EC2|nr:hypothetical protein [Polaromonas sp. AER18D-145]